MNTLFLSTVFSELVIDMICSECSQEVLGGVSKSVICLFSAVETIWIALTWRNYITMGVCCVLGILGMKGGWVYFGLLGYHVYNVSKGRSRLALNDICMKWGCSSAHITRSLGVCCQGVFAFAHMSILTMSIDVFILTWVFGLKDGCILPKRNRPPKLIIISFTVCNRYLQCQQTSSRWP